MIFLQTSARKNIIQLQKYNLRLKIILTPIEQDRPIGIVRGNRHQ